MPRSSATPDATLCAATAVYDVRFTVQQQTQRRPARLRKRCCRLAARPLRNLLRVWVF
jgi:hypothetical protein